MTATPLSAEDLALETWRQLQETFAAYEANQLGWLIGTERFQHHALERLAHWVNPDPECEHCYVAWTQWALGGEGPFTAGQLAYWDSSEVTSGFERRLLATIEAQAAENATLKAALEETAKFLNGLAKADALPIGIVDVQREGAKLDAIVLRVLAGKEAQSD